MSVPVEQSWARIERWLADHAPASLAALNPPASAQAIERLQATLGYALPEQLVVLLSQHDGAGVDWNVPQLTLPGGYGLMSAALIEQAWQTYTKALRAADDPDVITGLWWHPEWVPFAVAPSFDALVIDHRSGPRQGQIGDHLKELTYFESWGSLAEMLADVADGLAAQREVDGELPVVIDGELHWRGPDPRDLVAPS